jgi:hypothetical protein
MASGRTAVHTRSTSGRYFIAVRGEVAYITREVASRLLRLDLVSGARSEPADFAPLADADGVPDLGTMIVDGETLSRLADGRPLDLLVAAPVIA